MSTAIAALNDGLIELFSGDDITNPEPVELNPALADQLEPHARKIERLQSKAILRIVGEAAKIHETLRYYRNEGGYTGYMKKRLGYSSSSAYRLLDVHTRFGANPSQIWERLPPSALCLLASASTPKEALDVVAARVEAGETPSCALVAKIIAQAKGKTAISAQANTDSAPSIDTGSTDKIEPGGNGAQVILRDWKTGEEYVEADPERDDGTCDHHDDGDDIDHGVTESEPLLAGDEKLNGGSTPAIEIAPTPAESTRSSLRKAYDSATPEERKFVRDLALEEFFEVASISDVFDAIPHAQRMELFDLGIRAYAEVETSITPTKTNKKLLENLNGTLRWGLGQDDPASGAQALTIIKAKLAANKRGADEICLAFVKKGKR
jgi:hypothetical protein